MPTKNQRIHSWKNQGIISDDWDTIYDRYMNATHCEECGEDFDSYKLNYRKHEKHCKQINPRRLDHDHSTGKVRNVVCHSCNVKRSYRDGRDNGLKWKPIIIWKYFATRPFTHSCPKKLL